jgi:pimeloyl-ACP methyl ester carboxylesterase
VKYVVLDWAASIFGARKEKRRQIQYPRTVSVETLERRVVLTAVVDLTPTLVQFAPAAPGDKTTAEATVKNLGPESTKSFQVEFRLSTDATINDQDILIKTVTRRRLGAGAESNWTQKITLPGDLPPGKYFLGVIVDPKHKISEQNEANNVLATPSASDILMTSLNGTVQFGRTKQPVSIKSLGGGDVSINPDITTWLVIHGRNQSAASPDMVQLATTIDGYQPGDQVLLLDWDKAAASGALGGNGENFIKPVAAWAATALQRYGFSGDQLNLVGYSWGSYVAAEMAENLGTVNSVLSIEAAKDYPGGDYNPEVPGEVDFAAHANQSWAFFATGDSFGSAATSSTAEESFLIDGADHFKAVPLVTEILNPPQAGPLVATIPLSRLLTGTPQPLWPGKSYDVTGKLVNQEAVFDAVIETTPDGQHPVSVRYFDGKDEHTLGV